MESEFRLKLVITSGVLSSAKKKIDENSTYEFRIKINLVSNQEVKEKRLSPRTPLKEGLMEFSNLTEIEFVNVKSGDFLDFFPLIGDVSHRGRRYDVTRKSFQSFKITSEPKEMTLDLGSPPESFINLIYVCECMKVNTDILKSINGKKNISPKNIKTEKSLYKQGIGLSSGENIKKIEKVRDMPNLNLPILKDSKYTKNFTIANSGNQEKINLSNHKNLSFENKNELKSQKVMKSMKSKFDEKVLQIKIDNGGSQFVKENRGSVTSRENSKGVINTLKGFSELKYPNTERKTVTNRESNTNSINNKINNSNISIKEKQLIFENLMGTTLKKTHGHGNDSNMNRSMDFNLTFKSHGITDLKKHYSVKRQNTVDRDINKQKIIFLDYQEKELNYDINGESFCESFFSVSIPENIPKILDNSEGLDAPCSHQNCGFFPAYKPEIISRFPEKEHGSFDLNSIIASLCFPKGIKVCFNDDKIPKMNDFLIVNTNEYGVKSYIYVFHYYKKFHLQDFQNKYQINPSKDYLDFEKAQREFEFYKDKSDIYKKITKEFDKKLSIVSDFNFSDSIHLPIALCLLSKYPYGNQMKRCLESLFEMSYHQNFTESDINKFLVYLTKEIPIPPPNKLLKFFIPLQNNPIEIPGPSNSNLPLMSSHLNILLDIFTIDNILLIHNLILMESKIIFVSDHYKKLTEVIECFLVLLYPLQWVYGYIPILSIELLKFIQSPLPYLMGIDSLMIGKICDYLKEEEEENSQDKKDVYFVFLNPKDKESTVEKFCSKNLKKNKKVKLLNPFPSYVYDKLSGEMKEMKKSIDSNTNTNINLNKFDKVLRSIFMDSMVRMFGDYMKYLSFIDKVPIFNKESFLQTKQQKYRDFYDQLTETQSFLFFLQQSPLETYPIFYQLSQEFSDELEHISSEQRNSMDLRRTSSIYLERSGTSTFVNFQKNSKKKKQLSSFYEGDSSFYSSNSGSESSKISMMSKAVEYKEIYLIVPYFDTDKRTTNLDLNFNDETSEQKGNDYLKIVLDNQKEFDFPKSGTTFNRYLIPKSANSDKVEAVLPFQILPNQEPNQNNGESKNNPFVNAQIGNSIINNNLDLKKKEELENLISDYMRMIFTSKPLSQQQKNKFLSLLNIREARSQFAKLIYQTKFNEQQSHVVSTQSFYDLSQMVFSSLLQMNSESDFDDAILITKSCFYYCHLISKKYITITNELSKRNGAFICWIDTNFWVKWFYSQLKEEFLTAIEIEIENLYINILESMVKIMNELKLELKFTFECIIDHIALKVLKQEFINEVFQIIKKEYLPSNK